MSALQPIPDVVGPDLRLLLVGINPGVRSSRLAAHFAGHGNRFWRALHDAGVTPGEPWTAADQRRLVDVGVGITNLVARPTPRATDVTADELRAGVTVLKGKVARWRPVVVAVLGITAYRTAFARPNARPGPQQQTLSGAPLWLLPNPSGLNAHAKPADHALGLRAAAEAAGLRLHPSPGTA